MERGMNSVIHPRFHSPFCSVKNKQILLVCFVHCFLHLASFALCPVLFTLTLFYTTLWCGGYHTFRIKIIFGRKIRVNTTIKVGYSFNICVSI